MNLLLYFALLTLAIAAGIALAIAIYIGGIWLAVHLIETYEWNQAKKNNL